MKPSTRPPPLTLPTLLLSAALAVTACGDGQGEDTESSTSANSESSSESVGPGTTDDPGPKLEPLTWETSLEVGEEVGSFFGIWGTAADDMIAVGGQFDAGVIYRYDGESWAPDTIGFPVPRLNWVHGVDGHVVIVGHFGFALHLDPDGSWVRDMTPDDQALWGVWGAAADDLWAVGGSGGNDLPPLVLHYDGEAWSEFPLPPLESEGGALFKVWGTGADDVFAVGDRGLVVHFDGGAWVEETSTTLSSIIGVWGHPDHDVVIAGGRATGVVGRRTPNGWFSQRYDMHEGFDGVFVDADGIATVVGIRGFAARFLPGSLEFTQDETPTILELHSVYGLPDGHQFAVGGFFNSSPYYGVILKRPPPPAG